jgi:hypothetical protein
MVEQKKCQNEQSHRESPGEDSNFQNTHLVTFKDTILNGKFDASDWNVLYCCLSYGSPLTSQTFMESSRKFVFQNIHFHVNPDFVTWLFLKMRSTLMSNVYEKD